MPPSWETTSSTTDFHFSTPPRKARTFRCSPPTPIQRPARLPFPVALIVERDGVRIALIGATTPGSNAWDRDNLAGKLTIGAIVPAVRAQVDSARLEHANVIIVVVHTGLGEPSSYDTVATRLPSENVAAEIARQVAGIDLIVYGHSHKQMADTMIAGTLLMQPKNWAQSVAVAELRVEGAGGDWRVTGKRSSLIQAAGHAENPAVLSAAAAGHEAAKKYVAMTIGTTDARWSTDSGRVIDTPLADFILEVERTTAKSDLASTAVFDVGAKIDSGPVTVGEIARLYPYENTLSAVRITGAQLRAYLEYSARYYGTFGTAEPPVHTDVPGYNFDVVSGADYTIDLSHPVGSRITSLSVRGKPVRDSDSFTLALNNYRRSGGGGYAMLKDAPGGLHEHHGDPRSAHRRSRAPQTHRSNRLLSSQLVHRARGRDIARVRRHSSLHAMTRIIPVFVNSNKIELSTDSTALDAVRQWSEDAAREVLDGTRVITDDRGLPIVPDTVVHGGSIFRLVPRADSRRCVRRCGIGSGRNLARAAAPAAQSGAALSPRWLRSSANADRSRRRARCHAPRAQRGGARSVHDRAKRGQPRGLSRALLGDALGDAGRRGARANRARARGRRRARGHSLH